jgi:hypothetical protein
MGISRKEWVVQERNGRIHIHEISKIKRTIIDTYPSLLDDKTSSMLTVPKRLKQGELRVSAHHLPIHQ